MSRPRSCFVIIGYGRKTSYAGGKLRTLDLDETFTVLIKPVFDALAIPCYRAIDKNLSGSIDGLMLDEIRNADLALVDVSTLNANVMWELGVRHALKSKYTVMICEKEQIASLPFDIGHFVVLPYAHSEEGIPYKEVERFRGVLTNVLNGLINGDGPVTDSPVHTFLDMETSTMPTNAPTYGELKARAEEAKKKNDFATAIGLFTEARKMAATNMALKDEMPFIISRLALCTYKAQQPDAVQALRNAQTILAELQPSTSHDPEVLGLHGAIRKRLFDLGKDPQDLDAAIGSYDRGFRLKQDYYNGINTVYMLHVKLAMPGLSPDERADVKVKADYLRNAVLEIALALEQEPGFADRGDAAWVLLTIAEAYHYKRLPERMKEYEDKAQALAAVRGDSFAIGSYGEQKARIERILQNIA
ncbi:MAG TPA: TRAFs-binding domain-containing protein [Flavobacteriales bacterium]|nr:TRAFs-binding domain-containing protein [Flavobacteriales bacterium]